MSFTLSVKNKAESKAFLADQNLTPQHAPTGATITVSLDSPENASYRGEQINLETFLKTSYLAKNSMTKVADKVVALQKDDAGKPISAMFNAGAGFTKALHNNGIVNYTTMIDLNNQIKVASGAGLDKER